MVELWAYTSAYAARLADGLGSNPSAGTIWKFIMWIVKSKFKDVQHETLSGAMMYARLVNEFVTITDGNTEIVGKFGVDTVEDKVLPDGSSYEWTMRRDENKSWRKKNM